MVDSSPISRKTAIPEDKSTKHRCPMPALDPSLATSALADISGKLIIGYIVIINVFIFVGFGAVMPITILPCP